VIIRAGRQKLGYGTVAFMLNGHGVVSSLALLTANPYLRLFSSFSQSSYTIQQQFKKGHRPQARETVLTVELNFLLFERLPNVFKCLFLDNTCITFLSIFQNKSRMYDFEVV
jgi:hypothetical protein